MASSETGYFRDICVALTDRKTVTISYEIPYNGELKMQYIDIQALVREVSFKTIWQ
jgi:hypothetical protein